MSSSIQNLSADSRRSQTPSQISLSTVAPLKGHASQCQLFVVPKRLCLIVEIVTSRTNSRKSYYNPSCQSTLNAQHSRTNIILSFDAVRYSSGSNHQCNLSDDGLRIKGLHFKHRVRTAEASHDSMHVLSKDSYCLRYAPEKTLIVPVPRKKLTLL